MKIFLILFYLVILVYICPPTVTIGDVPELVGASSTLGIAHSPGYPLFCNIYKLFSFFIPFGDYGYKSALGSVVLFIFTGIICFFLIKNLTNSNIVALFCLTYLFSQEVLLKQSIVGEVFALHNFMVGLILYFMFYDNISFNKKLYIISLLLGLSFGNQHIIVFVLPSIFIWMFYSIFFDRYKFSLKDLFLSLLFFIIGFCIYFYVPIRSMNQPLYDWEDPQTLDRFIYLFTRGRYGALSLAQGGKIHLSMSNFYYGLKLFIYIIGTKNLFLLLISIFLSFFTKYYKKTFILLLICLIATFFTGPFIITISGLKTVSPNTIFIIERLVSTSILFIVLFVSVSFFVFISKFPKLSLVLYFLIFLNIFNFLSFAYNNSLRSNFFLYDYTYNIFHNLPYNSILFSDRADETEFSIAYYQRLKNIRKDIDFIDCNASVTRSIYGENYYKIWGEERLKIRTAIEKKIIEDAKTLVFYNTVLPKQTGIEKFKFGLLYSTKFIKDIFPEEVFLLRKIPKNDSPREFPLYITYLSLIAEYYFDVAKSIEYYFDIAKKYYNELFLLTLDVRYLSFIAYYYFLRNRYDLAEKEYKKVLNYPMDKDAYVDTLVNLGVVYEKQNKFDFAEECFYKAMRLKPKYPQIYYNLGSLYLKVNKKNEAAKMFEEYIKLNPYDEKIKKYIEILKQGL